MTDNVMTSDNGLWIFALLILLFGGNGVGFGGANVGRCASVEDLNNQANATRIEQMIQSNSNVVETKFDNLTKGLCDGFYNNAMQINSLEKNLTAQIGAISSKMDAQRIADLERKLGEMNTQQVVQQAICGIPKVNPYLYQIGCGCGFNNGNNGNI